MRTNHRCIEPCCSTGNANLITTAASQRILSASPVLTSGITQTALATGPVRVSPGASARRCCSIAELQKQKSENHCQVLLRMSGKEGRFAKDEQRFLKC